MDWNVYLFIQKPVYLALLFLILTPILILVFQPKHVDTAWLMAAYTFIVFLLVNASLLWFSNSPWRYFFYSLSLVGVARGNWHDSPTSEVCSPFMVS
jgi:hypothetical protein